MLRVNRGKENKSWLSTEIKWNLQVTYLASVLKAYRVRYPLDMRLY